MNYNLQKKYLLPYIPYDVNVKWIREDDNEEIISTLTISDFYFLMDRCKAKLILKPLHEFKNYEDILDEFSEHSLDGFENAFFILGLACNNRFDFVNYTIMELMFKHHLDIFQLIPQGLALDYNLINNDK